MDKHSDLKGGLALTLTLMAAITGSYFFLQSPLVSLRPSQGSVISEPTSEAQFVRARLWQDPLLAAYDDWKTRRAADPKPQAPDPLPHRIESLPENLQIQRDEKVLRLLVMQGEETYAENIEQRRRQRYALVSALTAKDYVPEDEAHIGYFLAPQFDGAAMADPAEASEMLVAYETFRYFDERIDAGPNATQKARKVQVLWLNATDFDEFTITRLSGLLAYMSHCQGADCSSRSDNTINVVLGPNSTGELTALYAERELGKRDDLALQYVQQLQRAARPRNAIALSEPVLASYATEANQADPYLLEAVRRVRQNLVLFPSNVTGPLDFVLHDNTFAIANPAVTAGAEDKVADALGVRLFRSSVLRDDLVLRKLLEELRHRGMCNDENARIFVVSEQDTLYGRILDDLLKSEQISAGCQVQINEIGYLRGIDGELPLSDANKTAEAAVPSESQAREQEGQTVAELFAPPGRERTVGPGQLDYISRLADRITREQKVPGPIAIGVLGSDVYDKLLILQSLKSRLPHALFFTTDLDSRLAGPEVYKWTRNLLIASSHNLEYDLPQTNGGTAISPVFRDAYQTAFFQATQMALDFAESDRTFRVSHYEPRLFEIGRTGPLELTPLPRTAADDSGTSAASEVREDQRVLFINARIPVRFLLCIPLLLFLAWALAVRGSGVRGKAPPFLERGPGRVHSVYGFDQAIVLLAAALALKLLFLGFVSIRGSEPLYLFEGVSVFPALSLQLSTTVMAAALLLITRGRLLQAEQQIQLRFGIERRNITAPIEDRVLGDEPLSVHELWSFHCRPHKVRKLAHRALAWAVLVWLVVLLLIHLSGTPSLLTGELRFGLGPLAPRADWLVPLVRALCLFSVLLMYSVCIHVYRFACRLMLELSRREVTGWTKASGPEDIDSIRQAMDLIVEITRTVTPIIYYPFFLTTMLLLSRNSLFEGWVWNLPLLLIFAGLVIYLLYQAAHFQRQAGKARATVLRRLRLLEVDELKESYARAQSGETAPRRSAEYARLLKSTMADIEELNSGAFVHWTSHPLFNAIALPSSSLGILTVLMQ